jgi:nitrite reductase/ring-hydroxylating ferredoxin subunit
MSSVLVGTGMIFYGWNQAKAFQDSNLIVKEVPADLSDGQMKEVQVGEKEDDAVLVARIDGKYYCIQNKCSHFGAPLGKMLLYGDKVTCDWHGAVFSVKTGRAEQGPVFDGL